MTTTLEPALTASANPFASRFINALPFHEGSVNVGSIIARLEAIGGRGAIVGAHGAGKTTLMRELGVRLADEGWIVHRYRTTPTDRTPRELVSKEFGPKDAILLDGAGHIGPVTWRRVRWRMRCAGRVVITAHQPGRLPTLHHCAPTTVLMDALIADLAGGRAEQLRSISHALYADHNGNIREVLRSLYDYCAGLSR